MTEEIPILNLPPNSNVKDIYNLITPAMEEAIIDSLISQKNLSH
ncbi:hypothetical protein [Rickettsia endosymbiont of Nabis limbatus]